MSGLAHLIYLFYEPLLQAAFLGMVEGITEFLPISSTGHLILVGHLIGFTSPGHVFEVFIQLGAIGAILWLYRQKFVEVVVGLPDQPQAQRFARNILLAFVPSLVVGMLAHDYIKTVLFSPQVVAYALITGGIAILAVERFKPAPIVHNTEAMRLKTALTIGLFQCVAMIPGVSRAGATIMGALLCRVSRPAAAEFSFFLAVPTMLGAASYDLYKNYHLLTPDTFAMLTVGFVAAFFTARLVVRWLLAFVKTHGFAVFAYYRIVVGLLMLWVLQA